AAGPHRRTRRGPPGRGGDRLRSADRAERRDRLGRWRGERPRGTTGGRGAEERGPGARRVGALHAVANVGALGLQIRSLSARRRGARGRGIALSLAANGLLGASGYLGGPLR